MGDIVHEEVPQGSEECLRGIEAKCEMLIKCFKFE